MLRFAFAAMALWLTVAVAHAQSNACRDVCDEQGRQRDKVCQTKNENCQTGCGGNLHCIKICAENYERCEAASAKKTNECYARCK